MRWTVLLAGILGAIGVAVGAHAAHGLEAMLLKQGIAPDDVVKRLEQCDVAVRYHMLHTVTLLVLALMAPKAVMAKRRAMAIVMFLLGIALFSGGLYSMVYLGQMGHWAIVPAGGMCFILGWCFTAALAPIPVDA